MDGVPSNKPLAYNRWLPYWAVLQADMQQTARSWVYRIWVLVSVLAAAGYLLYRLGVVQEAGILQPASRLVSDLLRWTLLGGMALIVVITASSISAERGTMADSVLSRAISRYDYFLAKWHSRLLLVLGTFLILAVVILLSSLFLLHEDLSLTGCVVALATVAALLGIIVTCGVAISAVVNSTLVGVALLWVLLYGGGFLLSLLPQRFPAPNRVLTTLPFVVRGEYHLDTHLWLIGSAVLISFIVACLGLLQFARRDI